MYGKIGWKPAEIIDFLNTVNTEVNVFFLLLGTDISLLLHIS